ncbi:MAG TPA: hypothetical protein VLB76_12245 [Thermoanaerobaculia bacterium]|nr:hypothetical protein [Thermoanaerobaculia bacterium]
MVDRSAELGVLSVSLKATLPKNAVMSSYIVTVTALRADQAVIGSVATVRVEGSQAVLDFGTLRTVRGLSVENMAGVQIAAVSPWNGLAFARSLSTGADREVSFPEIRTERLRLDLSGLSGKPEQEKEFAAQAVIMLADSPADLDLRLEGGPVVWSYPGPVRPGSGEWTPQSTFMVDLTAAIAPLAGDPTGQGDVSFRLVLSSRSPGILKIDDPPHAVFDRITRIVPKPDELSFTAEGQQTAALSFTTEERRTDALLLPAEALSIREVRFNAVGTFAPPRVLEPMEPSVSPNAELAVDPDHAFCVRLPSLQDAGAELAGDLAGVRLPLRAEPGGAEARIVLWAEAAGEPAEPVDGGASDPVSLDPRTGPDEAWTLFPFKRPLPLVKGRRLWATLLVARGALTWGLIAAPHRSSFQAQELRRGGPAGPWRHLPSIFARGSALAALRGRVRSVFLPAKATPLPALLMQLATAAAPVVEVTPVPRGVPVVLRFPSLAPVGSLQVTSRAVGTVSLREVDVVWSTSPPPPPKRSRDQLELAASLSTDIVVSF